RKRVKDRLGWTVTPGRVAILTRPKGNRAPCHYCGTCQRRCNVQAYFNSAFTTVADAMATGRCTLVSNAMVYKVLTDPDTHRATGVLYIHRDTSEPRELKAKAVVLCAQALESARILFNSAGRQDPGGLGNSSGVLGKYLMDHSAVCGADAGKCANLAHARSLDGRNRPNGIYVPRFQNTRTSRTAAFRRGYGFQGGETTTFHWLGPRRARAYTPLERH